MSGPFFQRQSWSAFSYDGVTYSLSHLDEMQLDAADSTGQIRKMAVTFEDHCFTSAPVTADPALVYPGSSRMPGHFSLQRYEASLRLPELLRTLPDKKVWNVEGTTQVYLPILDIAGSDHVYHIIFGLRRVKQLPVDLHLRIETAYVGDRLLPTYGAVQFRTLVTLVMSGKQLKKNFDRNRPRPRTF